MIIYNPIIDTGLQYAVRYFLNLIYSRRVIKPVICWPWQVFIDSISGVNYYYCWVHPAQRAQQTAVVSCCLPPDLCIPSSSCHRQLRGCKEPTGERRQGHSHSQINNTASENLQFRALSAFSSPLLTFKPEPLACKQVGSIVASACDFSQIGLQVPFGEATRPSCELKL